MLKKLISNILERSHYQIDDVIEQNDVLHIKLNGNSLKVSVNPTNTFNINGINHQENMILDEYINTHVRPPIKEIALKEISKGVKVWNEWRKQLSQIQIDLSQLSFSEIDFSGINFYKVDISYTQFSKVNLKGANLNESIMHETEFINCNLERAKLHNVEANLADFSNSNLDFTELYSGMFGAANFQYASLQGVELNNVNLRYADLSYSDLRGADLSRVIIDTETNFHKTLGVEKGINGYWNAETDSAALFGESPLGNSMKGPNIDAVLESLKRARKYFGFSFLLSLGAILLWYLKQDTTSLPVLKNFVLTKSQYLSIGMVFSLGLLVLAKSFIDDAFEGMKYLEDRSSAMAVGSFPWALTRFAGKRKTQITISVASRTILCLHPMLYLFAFEHTDLSVLNLSLLLFSTAIGIWILLFSEYFQLPILFDQKTEEKKQRGDKGILAGTLTSKGFIR